MTGAYCKNTCGEKLYRVSLNAGLSCPNQDGTLGETYCNGNEDEHE